MQKQNSSTEPIDGSCVVLVGNPVDGITIYGPFEDNESAEQWTADEGLHNWYITELNKP